MCGPYFNFSAKKAPAIGNYDVHIYFEKGADLLEEFENRQKANALALALGEAIPEAKGPFQVKAGMGPHTLPNVEVTIPPEALSKALTLLQLNKTPGISVLVHPHTGDEVLDHTKLVNWVGKPVPLNLDALLPPSQRKKNVPKISGPKAA